MFERLEIGKCVLEGVRKLERVLGDVNVKHEPVRGEWN